MEFKNIHTQTSGHVVYFELVWFLDSSERAIISVSILMTIFLSLTVRLVDLNQVMTQIKKDHKTHFSG